MFKIMLAVQNIKVQIILFTDKIGKIFNNTINVNAELLIAIAIPWVVKQLVLWPPTAHQ